VTCRGTTALALCTTATRWGSRVPLSPTWHTRRMPDVLDELLDITCPRCAAPATVRFYGPCDACRTQMRAEIGTEAREVEVAAYEPKMNVVPNAIASKE